jgi:RNA polymerase sigma-70 factor (ECF subfamily)
MPSWRLDAALVERLHRRARADQWSVTLDAFGAAIDRSVRHAFAGNDVPGAAQIERYLSSLHLEDLALACACAAGHEQAWDHFIREYRPVLYRAADAIDPAGGARDLADSLYGELFGLSERDGERRSHLRYFHGRSSLATWLRAVLSQRHVDRLRSARRLDPLPGDEAADAIPDPAPPVDPRWQRSVWVLRRAITAAVAALAPRDRLRLGCYYAQQLTLAEIGRALGEHEATVSRHLARARRAIREDVENQLRDRERMSEEQIAECCRAVVGDPGSLDVAELLSSDTAGKKMSQDRSR